MIEDYMEFPDQEYPTTIVRTTPFGDGLLVSVFEEEDFRSAVLSEPTVEVLRDWLTIWLEEER